MIPSCFSIEHPEVQVFLLKHEQGTLYPSFSCISNGCKSSSWMLQRPSETKSSFVPCGFGVTPGDRCVRGSETSNHIPRQLNSVIGGMDEYGAPPGIRLGTRHEMPPTLQFRRTFMIGLPKGNSERSNLEEFLVSITRDSTWPSS